MFIGRCDILVKFFEFCIRKKKGIGEILGWEIRKFRELRSKRIWWFGEIESSFLLLYDKWSF